MKKKGLMLLLSLGLLSSSCIFSQSSSKKASWILGIHNLVLNDTTEKAAARKYLETEFFPMFKETPGINVFLTERDRGNIQSEWAMLMIFDSKTTRDRYYPGTGLFSEEINQLLKKHDTSYQKFFRFFDKEKFGIIDYEFTGSTKENNAFGLFSIHDFKLLDPKKEKEAEAMVAKEYLPVFQDLPGMNAHFGKAERGRKRDYHVVLFVMDCKETRAKYYPKPEDFSSEPVQKVLTKYKTTFDKFSRYFGKEHSTADEYADYVVLSSAK